MNSLLVQVAIPFAQTRREENTVWIQILVFAVMAVLYVVAGIAKARAKKTQPQVEEEAGEEEPGADIFNLPKKQAAPKIQRPQVPASGPQAAATQISAIESGELLSEKPVPGLEKPKVPHEELIREQLMGLDDPDMLKRAILYYEILGKPVSLRDTPG